MTVIPSEVVKKIRSRIKSKEILYETKSCKRRGKVSDKLAKMFVDLVDRYGNRGVHYNYSQREDMKAHALMQLMKSWKSFNPDLSDNAFAYYVTVIKCAFAYYVNSELKTKETVENYENYIGDGNTNTGLEVDDEQHF